MSEVFNLSSKEPKGKATILDIAKASGVSKSTVSLVLNNSELVKPETAEKVRKVAAQLGYIYNRSAANLRQGVSNIIGVVVNDLTNTFFVELLIGAERKLLEANFTTLLAHTAEDLSLQQQVLTTMREHKVAGLIICPTFDTSPDLITLLKKWGIPFVTVMRSLDGDACDFVGADNRLGMKLLTQHLIDLGHKNIGFIGLHTGYSVSLERIQGFKECLQKNGLTCNDEWIREAPISREGGKLGIAQLMDLDQRPTAVICYNDLIAIGALSELNRRGLKAGEDIAVVGGDGISESEYCSPPLTTVAHQPEKLGEIASELLLARLKKPDARPLKFLLKPTLIIRESCGAKKK